MREALGRHRVLLDGEVVVFDTAGRPDFAAVRRRLSGRGADDRRAVFVVWDVLHLDGRATRALDLRERQALFADLLRRRGDGWCGAEPLAGPLAHVLSVLASHQLEGLVAKRLTSRWEAGRRSPNWRKHKLRRRQELHVGAWQPADAWRAEAFFLHDSAGRPAGQVTMGLGARERDALREAVATRATSRRRHGPLRVRPGIVVTVDAHGADGQPLRDGVLRAWRKSTD